MTERRPHWDDELIEAVSEHIDPGHADVRAVIATVEDWCVRAHLQAEVEALREKVKQHEVVFKVQAEALKSTREQVQRVREECEYPWFFDVGEHAGETPQGLPFVETAAVLKALDGGDE